jgi:hypothetical protein
VEAEKLLTEHRAQLDALTKALLVHDSLDEPEILEVTGIKPVAVAAAARAELIPAAAKATNRP